MKQPEFDGMSADRLEVLITCQRESTEFEKMLVKRLVYVEELANDADGSFASLESALDTANGEIDSLQETLDEADEKLDDIQCTAKDSGSSDQAVIDILEIFN